MIPVLLDPRALRGRLVHKVSRATKVTSAQPAPQATKVTPDPQVTKDLRA